MIVHGCEFTPLYLTIIKYPWKYGFPGEGQRLPGRLGTYIIQPNNIVINSAMFQNGPMPGPSVGH